MATIEENLKLEQKIELETNTMLNNLEKEGIKKLL